MTSGALEAFRERLGLSRSQFAEALEIDRATLRRYEGGDRPIPRHIALACAALAQGVPPME